jgi:DNA-binding CsgD family transcriptional regulator
LVRLHTQELDERVESDEAEPEVPQRIGHWLAKLPHIPLFFLGLGVYRAWIEIVFVGSYIDFPSTQYAGQDLFDLTMIAVMLLCALFSNRLRTLLNRSVVYWISGGLLIASTVCVFATLYFREYAQTLACPAAIMGGAGIALLILMWSEIYSCLNPIRVALYYSASLFIAALLIYMCRGFLMPWALAFSLALPVVSLLCVLASYQAIPTSDLSAPTTKNFSFPWKPVLLMSVYGFAFGLRETGLYTLTFGPHSSLGTVFVALLVFVGVLVQGRRFDFALIYRLGLPLMVGAFLLLPSFGFLNEFASGFCSSASYAAFSILTMLILANMSYRFGISALWLFGIERGVRALFIFFGRQVDIHRDWLNVFGLDSALLIAVLVILLVVVGSMVLYSEKELSSRWGVIFSGGQDKATDEAIIKKQKLASRCNCLAQEHHLSQREEEVLLLLAQKKTIATIERELFIANGTAKAHVRHIYQKLDIHSREELFGLLNECT